MKVVLFGLAGGGHSSSCDVLCDSEVEVLGGQSRLLVFGPDARWFDQ